MILLIVFIFREKENKQILANYNETLQKLNIANENLKNNTNVINILLK